jgi:hypothetical protein
LVLLNLKLTLYLSPQAIGVSRLSSGKPGKKYPGNPVDPVKKEI